MDSNLILAVGSGGGVAALAQMFKGEYNRWLTLGLVVGVAFVSGYIADQSAASGLVAAMAALSAHSALFAGTPIGKALKWELLPKILEGVAGISKSLAGNGTKPPASTTAEGPDTTKNP